MDDTPINSEHFIQDLQYAFKQIQGSSAWSMDRNRPYDGQPHTDCGVRGKTLVAGLTMRDIADCIVRGFWNASSDQRPLDEPERENLIHDDIYQIDLSKIDPGAVIQCTLCEVEKMMGIYPNVPKLTWNPPETK
jgi:hypothetical protein